jgi:hypothetical protein
MGKSETLQDQPAQCTCIKDGFGALPPEMRPKPKKKSSLRKVTCPGCGLVYSTNRETDLCMECEKKQRQGGLSEGAVDEQNA